MRDVGSTSESRAQADFTAPSFGAGDVSAPILAYQATGRGNLADPLNLVLNPRGSVGYGSDTLLAYVEGYQFAKPTTVPFKVIDEQQHVIHKDELRFRGGHQVESQVIRLSPDSVSLGEMRLVVGEGQAERQVSALVSFTQAWVVTNFDEMLELLRYFGHDDAVSAMRKAPESERARMWREFYAKTDPNNITPENEALNQYFGRIAQANQRFTDEGVPGWRTDRGEVFVNLGPPDEAVENSPGTTANRIVRWSYINFRLDIFFRDEGGFGRLRLLPSSRADYERTLARLRRQRELRPRGARGAPCRHPERSDGTARDDAASLRFPPYLPPMPNHTPPAALPDRRLRPDLPRLLRDDQPAAPDHQGREHLRRVGGGQLPHPPAGEVPPRLRRLGQRCRHLLPRASAIPTTSPLARSSTNRSRPTSTAPSSASCELLAVLRIPLVAIPGYEADDVIGTLAQAGAAARAPLGHRLGRQGLLSAHRPGIVLLNPGRGGPAAVDEVWVDESNAAERLGVPPSQVVDYLALVGDSSDNIPGVKGIGEKGALKLLAEYGDLEPSWRAPPRSPPSAPARRCSRRRTRPGCRRSSSPSSATCPSSSTSPIWCCGSRIGTG